MSARYCPRCDREWDNVPDHVVVLFHRCPVPDQRPQRRPTLEESRFDWARRLLGEALADAIDDKNELLRRVDDDE